MSAWKGFRVEPYEYRDLDDERVLALVRFSGRGKASGLEIGRMGGRAAHMWQVQRGKVR